ncbi:MAG: C45 family autoproteolytic acyltransferase/hydrolase [Gaiellaceae bacterium]
MTFPFPVFELDATDAFERGRQHGELAQNQIQALLNTYKQIFRDFVGVEWSSARKIGQSYAEPIERYEPDYLQEIRGVAAGGGFDEEDILALNARSEITFTAKLVDGCTAFAAFGRATPGETTVLAQNWDWRRSLKDSVVVLRIKQKERPSLTMVTEAGIIGKLGFNSSGLGVCLNALVTDRVEPGATPLHIVLRGILDAPTLSDAIGAASRANISCAANYLVAQHGAGAVSIEAVPGGVDVLLPERDVVVHTNHLRSLRHVGAKDLGIQAFPDSPVRLARISRLTEEAHGRIDSEAATQMLRDHAGQPDSICRHEDAFIDHESVRIHSVFSLVMNLEHLSLQMTDGPPCKASYHEYMPWPGEERAVLSLASS